MDALVLEMMKMNMTMGMKEYFFFSEKFSNFLFKDLNIHGVPGVVAMCLLTFALTFLLEGSRALMFYIQLRLRQNPLTYGRTDISINHDRSTLFQALMIPSSIDQIKKQRIQYHVGGYLLHTINLVLSYLLMLAVMSYDAYIFIAVIIGSGLGYFVFGAVNARNQAKFAVLQNQVYERYDSRVALTESQTAEIG